MKNDRDFLRMNNVKIDLVFTSIGDKSSQPKTFFTQKFPKMVENLQNKTFDENIDNSDTLRGDGVKFILTSDIIDVFTRMEILLGKKLSRHTDTPTEASNLIDEIYKKWEIQNEQQYRNGLDKFHTK